VIVSRRGPTDIWQRFEGGTTEQMSLEQPHPGIFEPAPFCVRLDSLGDDHDPEIGARAHRQLRMLDGAIVGDEKT
jgi:hypothetical protein